MEIQLSDGTGRLFRYADFPFRHLTPRNVDVWLPPGNAEDPDLRCPVLYMHDGQNLFDPALSSTGIDWGVDEAITVLMHEGRVPATIVVGLWCSPERRRDYMPAQPLKGPAAADIRVRFLQEQGGPPRSDAYLQFLTAEVKPYVDATFRTRPDRRHTFVMGSSMGGLVSIYALERYPDLFAGAGCLSTHWPIGSGALVDALGAALPPAGNHRLYFDFGTEMLDADYEPLQRRFDDYLRAAGYEQGRDCLTRKFQGAEHNEAAWRARVRIPLAFLLGA